MVGGTGERIERLGKRRGVFDYKNSDNGRHFWLVVMSIVFYCGCPLLPNLDGVSIETKGNLPGSSNHYIKTRDGNGTRGTRMHVEGPNNKQTLARGE